MLEQAIFGSLAVLALVAANGFFVAAEFSLVKVRKTRIDQLVSEGKSSARYVQAQLEQLDNYIAATQLGITLASLALGWVGEPAIARVLEPLLHSLAGDRSLAAAHTVAAVITFLIITTLHIVLGELVPKSVALQQAEKTSLWVSRPLYVFARVFRPFIMFMNGIGNMTVRLLGLHGGAEHTSIHTVEELEMLVSQSREAGILNPNEEVLLRRIFDFGDKRASQILTPRTEIAGVPTDIGLQELVELAATERYTRFPVYSGSLDNIVGVVNVKDLFALLYTGKGLPPVFELGRIMRPVIKVPASVMIDNLLGQLLRQQVHLAVVIDEYGGTAGIVTVEDILEEIVGEVHDEFDREDAARLPIERLDDGAASIDGLMSIHDFADEFGVELDRHGYETVAGFVFGQLHRAPVIGDVVSISGYQLEVEEMDGLRIARVKIRAVEPVSSDGATKTDSTFKIDSGPKPDSVDANSPIEAAVKSDDTAGT